MPASPWQHVPQAQTLASPFAASEGASPGPASPGAASVLASGAASCAAVASVDEASADPAGITVEPPQAAAVSERPTVTIE
jgi:hypothetical protein